MPTFVETTATVKIKSLDKRIRACSFEECDKPHHAKGYCTKHYQRYNKSGDASFSKTILRGTTSDHPLTRTYFNMISRCTSPKNKRYAHYGGRGIKVCDRWFNEGGFKYFAADMGQRPRGMTLDRIDVNKDYSPENCRWADKFTQMSNMQTSTQHTGVSWHKPLQKWRARVKVNGKERHLGVFNTLEEAVEARAKAMKEIHAAIY